VIRSGGNQPLLRFSRDLRVISFTIPAGADAAE